MKRKLSLTKQLTLGGMVTSLTLLCLYISAVMPVGRLPLLFLAILMPYVIACEGAYAMAYVSYIASCIISLCIVPDKIVVYIYILLLGHYIIFRTILHKYVSSKLVLIFLKLIYFNLFAGLGIYLSQQFGVVLPGLPAWAPLWLFIVLTELLIVALDTIIGAGTIIYQYRLRNLLIAQR